MIYEDIVQWSFLCFQFQLSDNSTQVFWNLQTGERTLDGEIFSEFLDSTADCSQIFYVFIFYLFFLLNFQLQVQSYLSATQHW